MDIRIKPSLERAYGKVDWAYERLTELKKVYRAFCRAYAETVTAEFNTDPVIDLSQDPQLITACLGHVPIPDRLPILVGEIVFHLRSALNYLVVQLALLDSGQTYKFLQFPIESTPNGFRGRKKDFLKGISDPHIAKIEALQPYNGCHWTEPLREMSNFDKHTDYIVVQRAVEVGAGITSIVPAEGNTSKMTVQMQLKPMLHIALRNGTPVIETLEMLHAQVAQTLDGFNPLFD